MIADRTDRQPYMYYMKTYMYYTTARETHMNFHLTCTHAMLHVTLFTPQKYMYWHLACIYMYVHALLKEPAPLWRLAACCAPKLDPFTYMVTQ